MSIFHQLTLKNLDGNWRHIYLIFNQSVYINKLRKRKLIAVIRWALDQMYFTGTSTIYRKVGQSTSSTCNLESSVKASISCLLIPASIRNIRAPSFIVSVRSSLLSNCRFLTACLKVHWIRNLLGRITYTGKKGSGSNTDKLFFFSAGLLLILDTFSLARTIRFSSRFHWNAPSLNSTCTAGKRGKC